MTTFLIGIIVIVLVAVSSLFSMVIARIMSFNYFDLKTRAQSGEESASALYPLRSLGNQLIVTGLIVKILAAVLIMLILAFNFNIVIALAAGVVLIGVTELMPLVLHNRLALSAVMTILPFLKRSIAFFSPVSRKIGTILDVVSGEKKTNIYSKEELYSIVETASLAEHSDIDEDEIRIVRHALSFSSRPVRDVMTPRSVVKVVSENDMIGPVFIDELHKSGFSRFPVIRGGSMDAFCGTLYLRDVVMLKKQDIVKDVMHDEVFYIHEEQSLDYALRTFLKIQHHLLIVVNTFEEFVGVLTIEDVIEQILGKNIVDEFDQHEDMRAVAKSYAEKERKKRERKKSKS